MVADHIVMSSGCVCMAIKPGSTSVYMCKTHFPEQQEKRMKEEEREEKKKRNQFCRAFRAGQEN